MIRFLDPVQPKICAIDEYPALITTNKSSHVDSRYGRITMEAFEIYVFHSRCTIDRLAKEKG